MTNLEKVQEITVFSDRKTVPELNFKQLAKDTLESLLDSAELEEQNEKHPSQISLKISLKTEFINKLIKLYTVNNTPLDEIYAELEAELRKCFEFYLTIIGEKV